MRTSPLSTPPRRRARPPFGTRPRVDPASPPACDAGALTASAIGHSLAGRKEKKRDRHHAGRFKMPKVKVNDITINYEQQGEGEPLVLIPYLAADNACYAFQVADYAKHFTCISIDPRGAGETDKPEGTYSTELFADDVAAFMAAIGVEAAHVIRPVARRGDRTLARRQISSARQVPVAAQLLAQDRPVPEGSGRGLAIHRQRLGQRPGNDHPGYLPWCLTPTALRREARLYRPARRLRAQPAEAADGRFHAPVERRDRARRVEPARPDRRRPRKSPLAAATSPLQPASPTR